ncbi:helix-turn-helix transcriptional regulator [Nocardioides speluncae]|uniref:helix-turn-helix transcriptional regulator n=1 Tax=Nocardioides speluncae TaxID=2670337 RepID=UPI000D687F77|nr:helix-turn-helix domain-containing protein [Nocardioides speluncae]
MTEDAFARRVTRVGSLADPVRRALYRFVSAQPDAVSRDQAADGVDVPRHTAKFHLERLVDEGLLVPEFRRLTGRSGPGAGRPAKLYRRARKEVSVSVPSRRYDLAGQVLADAVERALDGAPMNEAVTDAAQQAAADAVHNAKPTGKDLARVAGVLADYGYEPQIDEDHGDLTLGNCPYDRLAAEHQELVCGMNLDFVRAVADRLGCDGDRVELAPDPPRCCVRVLAPSK